eukprot:scaffold16584_cov80-Skeletonema_dohrnii-CCMP3373.AAC.1
MFSLFWRELELLTFVLISNSRQNKAKPPALFLLPPSLKIDSTTSSYLLISMAWHGIGYAYFSILSLGRRGYYHWGGERARIH